MTIDGCKYPMLLTNEWTFTENMFVGGYETSTYGTSSDLSYYVENGKVNAGVMSENYRDYVQMVHAEQFSIMLATGDYPDYLGAADTQVSGGIDSLVEQEICVDLAPLLDECMPDFKNGFYKENEEYRKYITSDTGHITTIYNYEMQSSTGAYIRKDWLDQLGMEIPETYDAVP